MRNEETVRAIIGKAMVGGYDSHGILEQLDTGYSGYDGLYITAMIFDHGFAKAFWGQEKNVEEDGRYESFKEYWHSRIKYSYWQYHLQQMVLQADPIKYLEKFL